MNRFILWLRAPVDGASLAVFRIAFGAIPVRQIGCPLARSAVNDQLLLQE